MSTESDTGRNLLRHTLATLAYRGGKTLRDSGDGFATFRAGEKSRTPLEIVAHIGDLMEWALSIARGQEQSKNAEASDWDQQVNRFFSSLEAFDAYLASANQLGCPPQKLFQAPIADALTHVGQLAMLRGLSGNPIRGENYFVADISVGRVGREQYPPRSEF